MLHLLSVLRLRTVVASGLIGLALCLPCATAHAAEPDVSALVEQVKATERAFAKTMADRDFNAFTRFVSDEAIFLNGSQVLHGKKQVAEIWKRYFDKPVAPFSWEPDQVEVLGSGGLALSSGPVKDVTGKIVGRFNSTWRMEGPGVWRIVFDKGSDVCEPAKL